MVRVGLIDAMDGKRFAVSRLLPPPGLPRVIAFQSAMIAVGTGTFLTGSIVFFNHVLGLSPLQIGTGFSIAGLAGVVTSLPLGALADRVGGQRSWLIGAIVAAAAFAAYALVTSFVEFIVLMIVIATTDSFANAGRTMYTADAMPPGDRVRTMAFARSYLNIGFTIGTGIGALALAVSSTAALDGMVLLNAAIFLVNGIVVSRLPAAPTVRHARVKRSQLAVLKDGPYVMLAFLVAVVMFHAVVFTEIIPLWAITHTDLPKPILGALFALNMVLAVALQVPATRGVDSLPSTVRVLRRGALATAIACPLAALSGMTHSGWTIVVLTLVVILTTTTELWLSAALWFYQTDVPPAAFRGAYIGMAHMISSVASIFAPAGLTLLAIQTGGWGWWVIAAIFIGCAIAARPTVDWVARTPRIDGIVQTQRASINPAPETAG